MEIDQIIRKCFNEILEESDQELKCELASTSILLNTGLDSLGFAILVAKLDDELGYDPFTLMAEPFYPSTYQEFLDIYQRFKSHRTES